MLSTIAPGSLIMPEGFSENSAVRALATAMRLVNAVPAVVDAPPGLLTALDLPLITGRGLMA